MKIKKGDSVIVIAGKDKGRVGKVLRALPKHAQVIIEGVNIKKKSQRPTRSNQKGQIINKTLPIHVSNVMIIDSKSNKPTRVGYSSDDKGRKIRLARKSGSVLDA
jgi:large subunit ribosomal protein L24